MGSLFVCLFMFKYTQCWLRESPMYLCVKLDESTQEATSETSDLGQAQSSWVPLPSSH